MELRKKHISETRKMNRYKKTWYGSKATAQAKYY